jgi:LysM domain
MELKNFAFAPIPSISRPLRFASGGPDTRLGLLEGLIATWMGRGFNVIWRPFHGEPSNQDHFLELNLTQETLRFEEIPGAIPNRGLLQSDINMFGLWYLQTISDANIKGTDGKPAGLHLEPGIWATVPKTEHPQEMPTVVRMASIPHGTTILAQGVALNVQDPDITDVNITPFVIGNPAKLVPFPESDLAKPSPFRTAAEGLVGIDQPIVDNPNLVLKRALDALAGRKIKNTVVLAVSSDPSTPVFGGGTENTAFLQGSPSEGPNAQAAIVTATFWLETVEGPVLGGPDFHQLQYTQRVLLNFNGLSWPHITVATLLRSVPYIVKEGDTLSSIALQFYENGEEPLWRIIYNANVGVIGPDPNVLTTGQELNIPT